MKPRKKSNWKLERASVHHKGAARPKSNKYTKNDSHPRPAAHTRSKIWVGGYTRADGRHVEGHFRKVSVFGTKVQHMDVD